MLLPDVAAAFGDTLHAAGVPVTPERSARFANAVSRSHTQSTDDLYWIGRVTLLSTLDQVATYDRVFQRVFGGYLSLVDDDGIEIPAESSPDPMEYAPRSDRIGPPDQGHLPQNRSMPEQLTWMDEQDAESPDSHVAPASLEERLATRPFSECTEAELALIRDLIDDLAIGAPMRISRRNRASATGHRLDLRATMHRARRTGGDPVNLARRQKVLRPRRVVLLCDVSGSMEPYARVYLHLLHGAVRALGAEAFAFGTRLTRLTAALAAHDPDFAYQRAVALAQDWSGGTRLGSSLLEFVEVYGRRGVARGAVIVIVSDGWDVEDAATTREAMRRLSRLAHHVIWVNPRKASESFQPLVGGMAAALPFVDTFVSGHSMQALTDVTTAIRTASHHRQVDTEGHRRSV